MIRLIRELGYGPHGYEIDANWLPLHVRALMKRRRPWWRFWVMFWWFVALGSMSGGPTGVFPYTVGPFKSQADCERVKTEVQKLTRGYPVSSCWADKVEDR